MNTSKKSQLYLELESDLRTTNDAGKYLVIVHADDSMGEKEIKAKLKAAKDLGIRTVHILYQYPDEGAYQGEPGPLFRQSVLDEEQSPYARTKSRPVKERYSLEHYPAERRENFRLLKNLERNWIPAISGKTVLYYRPDESQLSRYQWGDVAFGGETYFGEPRNEISRTIKEPQWVEDIKQFSLIPLVRDRYSSNLADIMALPDIWTLDDAEVAARRTVAKLRHIQTHNLPIDKSGLLERACIQLEDVGETSLTRELERIIDTERAQAQKPLPRIRINTRSRTSVAR